MAEEILRSRHAFGSLENVQQAIIDGKIDELDILFVKDANGKPYIGWIDKQKNPVIVKDECVIPVDSLPKYGEAGKIYVFNDDGYFWNGSEFVNLCKPTDLTELEAKVAEKADLVDVIARIEKAKSEAVTSANAYADEKTEAVLNEVGRSYEKIKYEITSTPEGTLVNYRENEIRVMCPADTKWVKQSVGGTGNANMYYMGFKAYAPEGAVSFKEGDRGVIIDEMFDFNGDFAGTDEFGRNYSICWLALASYDAASDTWTYFGKNSSVSKYIGWDYIVEWYNSDGIVIASDKIRINLTNEECHLSSEPYYVSNIMKDVEVKIEEKIAEIEAAYEIVEF